VSKKAGDGADVNIKPQDFRRHAAIRAGRSVFGKVVFH